ncbi:hypothetical protein FDP41_013278 [Naegleria fowleri]|uniref:Uncharacterized protein n=1 Tax=Naegleria fowleri TaxID=5763 RepID=A0A6A5C5P4_NAEFO|nr:uncharacterized protein FDP41_013278 [Naegleria fowleri]KAF0980795.1 hypothetical protein FDP41_013278 [Naegleria fowleri]
MVSSLTHIHKYLTGYIFCFGYLVYKSYEHFQTFRWLGGALEFSPSTVEKFKELFPLEFELITKLKRIRDLSFNVFAPAGLGLGLSFLYPWYFRTPQLHHVSTQTVLTRGFKVIYFSLVSAMLSGYLPFLYAYKNIAPKHMCEETTLHFYSFSMSQKDKDWSKKLVMSRHGIKPHPFHHFKD